MTEPQTPSDLMMQSQMPKAPVCVFPDESIPKFLLEVIEQTNFPGKMAEYVSGVKQLLKDSKVA